MIAVFDVGIEVNVDVHDNQFSVQSGRAQEATEAARTLYEEVKKQLNVRGLKLSSRRRMKRDEGQGTVHELVDHESLLARRKVRKGKADIRRWSKGWKRWNRSEKSKKADTSAGTRPVTTTSALPARIWRAHVLALTPSERCKVRAQFARAAGKKLQGLSTFPITSRQLDHQKPLHNKKELAL